MANFGMIGGGLVVAETIDKKDELILTGITLSDFLRIQCYKTGKQCHLSFYISASTSTRSITIEFPNDMKPNVYVDCILWLGDDSINRSSIDSSTSSITFELPANKTIATNFDWISEY